jgi:anti-anti-sigma regulatory factor
LTGLEPLVVQIDQGSSVLRLVVSGELDIATVPDLEAAFEQALGTDPQSIEVDLSQVTLSTRPASGSCC